VKYTQGEVIMTSDELKDLHERLKYATAHGFAVACAEGYADELVAMGASADPPDGVAALSAAHLLSMAEAALAGGPLKMKKPAKSSPPPAVKKADAPAPKAAAPKAEEAPMAPAAEDTKQSDPAAAKDESKS
jgi:hypothetical protein